MRHIHTSRAKAWLIAGLGAILITAACGDATADQADLGVGQESAETTTTTALSTPDEPDSATDEAGTDEPSTDSADTDEAGTNETSTDTTDPDSNVDASDTERVGPDDWILDRAQPGELWVDGELIGEEESTTLAIDADSVASAVLTVNYGDATAEIEFILPRYDMGDVTLTLPDGAVHVLPSPSHDYPSTAITVEGSLADDDSVRASLATAYLAGTTSVELDGNRAVLRGRVGTHTPAQLQYLIDEHPEVDTLVLADIEGAIEDTIEQTYGSVDVWQTIDVATGVVRGHGYTTVIPVDGRVSDSGLLLFAAGTDRIIETTDAERVSAKEIGEIGVRATCCGWPSDQAHEYDQYSAMHQADVQRWSTLLGEEQGTAVALYLVWASIDGPHNLSLPELEALGLATTPIIISDTFGPTAPADDPYLGPTMVSPKINRPEELVDAIVESFNAGEAEVEEAPATATRMVVFDTADQTLAYILVEGGADDSAGGEIARLVLEGDDEFGWVVVEVTQRFICRRGLSDGTCL